MALDWMLQHAPSMLGANINPKSALSKIIFNRENPIITSLSEELQKSPASERFLLSPSTFQHQTMVPSPTPLPCIRPHTWLLML